MYHSLTHKDSLRRSVKALWLQLTSHSYLPYDRQGRTSSHQDIQRTRQDRNHQANRILRL